jgi:hypothetical protein
MKIGDVRRRLWRLSFAVRLEDRDLQNVFDGAEKKYDECPECSE